jgi:hypothetical protein
VLNTCQNIIRQKRHERADSIQGSFQIQQPHNSPETELGQVHTIGIGHGGQKIVTRYGRSIVALKVQIHALSESIFPEQGLVHPNDLRSFVVHSASVKVVHADV